MDGTEVTRFAIVPEAVLIALCGDPTALALYTAIALHVSPDGDAWPSQARLAELLGCHSGTVGRTLARCVRAGVVSKSARLDANGHKVGNIYRVFRAERAPARDLRNAHQRAVPPRTSARSTRARDPLSREGTKPMNKKEISAVPAERHLASVVALPTGRLLDVPSVVDTVFDAWRLATQRTGRTVLTPKRRKVIEARIREGYEVDDLVDAVRGWRRSTFHCGQNEQGTVYNELTLLLRDGEHVEQFRDLERGASSGQAAMRESENVALIRRQREREGR